MRTYVVTGSQGSRGFQACFGQEALREGRQCPVGQIEFDAFNAVHGEENDGGGKGLAIAHHDCEVFKGREFGAAEAQAFRSKSQNHPPELFARIAESGDDQRPWSKRCAGDRSETVLLHAKIVAGRSAHCKSMLEYVLVWACD